VNRLATWLPPVAWTAVVLSFSSATFSADNTSGVVGPLLAWLFPWLAPSTLDTLHGLLRKGAHLTEYAILGALLLRALGREAPAFALGVAYAISDEVHQHFVRGRHASPIDVAIDAVGLALGLVAWRRFAR
jgi:VanZ family protein